MIDGSLSVHPTPAAKEGKKPAREKGKEKAPLKESRSKHSKKTSTKEKTPNQSKASRTTPAQKGKEKATGRKKAIQYKLLMSKGELIEKVVFDLENQEIQITLLPDFADKMHNVRVNRMLFEMQADSPKLLKEFNRLNHRSDKPPVFTLKKSDKDLKTLYASEQDFKQELETLAQPTKNKRIDFLGNLADGNIIKRIELEDGIAKITLKRHFREKLQEKNFIVNFNQSLFHLQEQTSDFLIHFEPITVSKVAISTLKIDEEYADKYQDGNAILEAITEWANELKYMKKFNPQVLLRQEKLFQNATIEGNDCFLTLQDETLNKPIIYSKTNSYLHKLYKNSEEFATFFEQPVQTKEQPKLVLTEEGKEHYNNANQIIKDLAKWSKLKKEPIKTFLANGKLFSSTQIREKDILFVVNKKYGTCKTTNRLMRRIYEDSESGILTYPGKSKMFHEIFEMPEVREDCTLLTFKEGKEKTFSDEKELAKDLSHWAKTSVKKTIEPLNIDFEDWILKGLLFNLMHSQMMGSVVRLVPNEIKGKKALNEAQKKVRQRRVIGAINRYLIKLHKENSIFSLYCEPPKQSEQYIKFKIKDKYKKNYDTIEKVTTLIKSAVEEKKAKEREKKELLYKTTVKNVAGKTEVTMDYSVASVTGDVIELLKLENGETSVTLQDQEKKSKRKPSRKAKKKATKTKGSRHAKKSKSNPKKSRQKHSSKKRVNSDLLDQEATTLMGVLIESEKALNDSDAYSESDSGSDQEREIADEFEIHTEEGTKFPAKQLDKYRGTKSLRKISITRKTFPINFKQSGIDNVQEARIEAAKFTQTKGVNQVTFVISPDSVDALTIPDENNPILLSDDHEKDFDTEGETENDDLDFVSTKDQTPLEAVNVDEFDDGSFDDNPLPLISEGDKGDHLISATQDDVPSEIHDRNDGQEDLKQKLIEQERQANELAKKLALAEERIAFLLEEKKENQLKSIAKEQHSLNLSEKLISIEEHAAKLAETNKVMSQEIALAEKAISEFSIKELNMEKELAMERERALHLTKEKESLDQQLALVESQKIEAEQHALQLSEKLISIEQHAAKLAETNEVMSQEIALAEKAMSEFATKELSMEKELVIERERTLHLTEEKESSDQQLALVESQKIKAEQHALQLSEKLISIEQHAAKLAETNEVLSQEIALAEKAMSEFATKELSMEKELTMEREHALHLTKEKESLDLQLALVESQKAELSDNLNEKTKETESLKERVKELMTEKESILQELSIVKKSVEKFNVLEKEIEQLKVEAEEHLKLKRVLESLSSENKSLIKEKLEMEKHLMLSQKSIEDLNIKSKELESEKEALDAGNSAVIAQLVEAEKKSAQLNRQFQEVQSEYRQVKSKLDEITNLYENLKNQFQLLQYVNSDIQIKLANKEDDTLQLKLANEKILQQLQLAKSGREQLVESCKNYAVKIKEVTDQSEQLKAKYTLDLKNSLKMLQDLELKNKALHEQLETSQSAGQYIRQIEKLTLENDKLKSKIMYLTDFAKNGQKRISDLELRHNALIKQKGEIEKEKDDLTRQLANEREQLTFLHELLLPSSQESDSSNNTTTTTTTTNAIDSSVIPSSALDLQLNSISSDVALMPTTISSKQLTFAWDEERSSFSLDRSNEETDDGYHSEEEFMRYLSLDHSGIIESGEKEESQFPKL